MVVIATSVMTMAALATGGLAHLARGRSCKSWRQRVRRREHGPSSADADVVKRSNEREAILKALAEANDEPLSPRQLAMATGMKPVNARKLMQSMEADGMIKAAKYGKYLMNIG